MSVLNKQAVIAWRSVLGQENVIDDPDILEQASYGTFLVDRTIPLILFPKTREQVRECVCIAQQYLIALYPISQGKNWGLGSKIPVQDNCVVLDLSQLQQIIHYDPELAYIVVEAGVTFYQVAEYLRQNGNQHYISATGATGHGSLIGNALERGEGIGRYGERVNSMAALEVVLADGCVINTGFSNIANSQASHTHAYGVGMSLDGLFVQSNLGIVTQATFFLEAIPNDLRLFNAELQDEKAFFECIRQLRCLVSQGVFQGIQIFLWNRYKFLARQQRYPWHLCPTPPLNTEIAGDVPWRVSAFLTAPSVAVGESMAQYVMNFCADTDFPLQYIGRVPQEQIADFLAPSEENIKTAYWRKTQALPDRLNPEYDRCGIHWICFSIPLDEQLLYTVFQRCEQIVLAHGLEPQIGAGILSVRAVNAFVSLMYDRDIEGEDQRAQQCHDAILMLLNEMNVPLYRLGIQSMSWLQRQDQTYQQVRQKIKQLFDPQDILSPKRYQ